MLVVAGADQISVRAEIGDLNLIAFRRESLGSRELPAENRGGVRHPDGWHNRGRTGTRRQR